MEVTIRRAVNPTDEELDRVTLALSEAFHYEYFTSGLGGDKSLVPPILRAHVAGGLLVGEVYFAELPGEGIVGGAVWFGPGQYFLDTEEQRNAGWNQVMQRLEQKYVAWWDYFLDTYSQHGERIFGPGVKRGSYHLQLIGVVPNHQKKGIGEALIKAVEDQAKIRQVPLCVETAGALNVGIYKSLGFTALGEGAFKSVSQKEFIMSFLLKHV